jgi:hypothetical protein
MFRQAIGNARTGPTDTEDGASGRWDQPATTSDAVHFRVAPEVGWLYPALSDTNTTARNSALASRRRGDQRGVALSVQQWM